MSYTLKEAVHVDIRIDGEDISKDFGPGDIELPQAIADLLVAQGLATVSKAKSKPTDDTPVTKTIDPSAAEA